MSRRPDPRSGRQDFADPALRPAVDRRAPVREPRRRSRAGVLRRRHHRGPDHRAVPLPGTPGDRTQLGPDLQGQAGPRAGGRPRPRRPLRARGERPQAGAVRITAQLVDAATGHHLWAERFDRDLADIFEVQDEVTSRIVATLAGKLAESERRRARSGQTENLEAYDCVLRGRELWDRLRPRPIARRAACTRKRSSSIPTTRAYASLAWTYLVEHSERWGGRGPAARACPRDRAPGCHGEPGVPLEPSALWARSASARACTTRP